MLGTQVIYWSFSGTPLSNVENQRTSAGVVIMVPRPVVVLADGEYNLKWVEKEREDAN